MRPLHMLARAWGLVCRLLKPLADYAHLQRIRVLEDDLEDARHQIRGKDSKIALLEGEVEFLAEWRAAEIETKRTEKQAQIARRVVGDSGRDE